MPHPRREQSGACLGVRARCTCGCGTAYFELDTSEVEPAPVGPGILVAPEAQRVIETGEYGRCSALVCWRGCAGSDLLGGQQRAHRVGFPASQVGRRAGQVGVVGGLPLSRRAMAGIDHRSGRTTRGSG
ncbi:hypothetical protein FNH09_01780 [Streptomyces adustus]|uniref:Uncharacterized protein n=1 Tax=Streptomyces adustus TaxID=1609272 RepID=A0A5N8V7Y8_9ACTN|nr:hypothetical protein [Streptomyces adustus]